MGLASVSEFLELKPMSAMVGLGSIPVNYNALGICWAELGCFGVRAKVSSLELNIGVL